MDKWLSKLHSYTFHLLSEYVVTAKLYSYIVNSLCHMSQIWVIIIYNIYSSTNLSASYLRVSLSAALLHKATTDSPNKNKQQFHRNQHQLDKKWWNRNSTKNIFIHDNINTSLLCTFPCVTLYAQLVKSVTAVVCRFIRGTFTRDGNHFKQLSLP